MGSPTDHDPCHDAALPDWFTAALATEPERARIDVEGTPVAYRAWGQPGGPGIVLVHGGAAHSRWWDHIAPLMTAGRRVAALDLSGHGDSGRRETYSLDMWAREVLAVAAAAGITAPPIVIGHSMGGFVTLRLASLYGSRIAGAVIIDSPIRDLTPEEQAAREHRAFGPLRIYPTRRRPSPGSIPSLTSPRWATSPGISPRRRYARSRAAGRGSSIRGSSAGRSSGPPC